MPRQYIPTIGSLPVQVLSVLTPGLKYPELARGLVGAWCPSVGGNTGGILYDGTGLKKNGVLTNMDPATDLVLSEGRWALDFDGGNDEVVVTHEAALNITEDMTIIGWIKTTNAAANGPSLMSKYGGNLNTVPYMTYLSAGIPTILLGEGASFAFVQAGASISDGTWRHFSATMRGTVLTQYMEAKSRGTDTFSGTRQTNTDNLKLGYSGLAFADSQIDDVRLYNRALSEWELVLDYSLGRGGWAEGIGTLPSHFQVASEAAAAAYRNRFYYTRTNRRTRRRRVA